MLAQLSLEISPAWKFLASRFVAVNFFPIKVLKIQRGES